MRSSLLISSALIRRTLLDDGHIDTVIGLPANLIYSTGSQASQALVPPRIEIPDRLRKAVPLLNLRRAGRFGPGELMRAGPAIVLNPD